MSKVRELLQSPGLYKSLNHHGCPWFLLVHEDLRSEKGADSLCSKISLFALVDGMLTPRMATENSFLMQHFNWEAVQNFKFTLVINEDNTIC